LAKYAVAWGAIIKKNPLVSDFLDKCGLDAATLEDPRANLHRVVEYLEARMPDDNVVVRGTTKGADWAPSPIRLTALGWTEAKKRGEAEAGLAPLPTAALDAALARFEPEYAAAKQTVDGKQPLAQADKAACLQRLQQIRAGLQKCQPKRVADGQTTDHR